MPDPNPVGKIKKPDGTDVSDRDRSDDGVIVINPTHKYKFGAMPPMPWHMVECPKCEGQGTVETLHTWLRCDLCDGEGEVKSFRAKRYLKDAQDERTD